MSQNLSDNLDWLRHRVSTVLYASVSALSYVAAIHFRLSDNVKKLSRDHPIVIRDRFKRIIYLCGILTALVPLISSYKFDTFYSHEISAIHLVPSSILEVRGAFRCLIAISVLYSGPIWNYFRTTPRQFWLQDFHELFFTLHGIRNHVFAPITEELIYRGLIISVLKHDFTNSQIIQFSPLLFGVAHVHHAYELYFKRKIAISTVLMSTTFQLLYTTLFGAIESYIFLKYNSLWAPIVVHSFCNLMSIPELSISGAIPVQTAYYGLLLFGIFGFYKIL